MNQKPEKRVSIIFQQYMIRKLEWLQGHPSKVVPDTPQHTLRHQQWTPQMPGLCRFSFGPRARRTRRHINQTLSIKLWVEMPLVNRVHWFPRLFIPKTKMVKHELERQSEVTSLLGLSLSTTFRVAQFQKFLFQMAGLLPRCRSPQD